MALDQERRLLLSTERRHGPSVQPVRMRGYPFSRSTAGRSLFEPAAKGDPERLSTTPCDAAEVGLEWLHKRESMTTELEQCLN